MSALISLMATVAAQAAQSTTASPSTPPTVTEPTKARSVGQSTYIDLEGGAGYSTNPNLSLGSDTDSGSGYVSLHGVHTRVTDRTTTLVSVFAQETAYTSRYGSNQSVAVTGRHDAAVSEKLRVFVDGSAAFDKNGQLDTRIISVPDVPVFPGSPDIPPQALLPGSDFLAVTGKHYSFSAHAGGALALSPRENLNFSTGFARSVLRNGGEEISFWSIPASVGYGRQISPRTNVGGRLSFLHTNYNGPGSISTVTPQLTASIQISERMSLNGAVGVSYSSIDDGVRTRHSTGLSANSILCNQQEYSHLCARVAIDQTQPTVGGPAKAISAGVDYARQLDERSSFQLSADGSRYSSPISLVNGQTFSSSTYYRAAAAYTRGFGHRLFGGINVAARKLSQRGPDPKTDFGASLFIRYRFGDLQ